MSRLWAALVVAPLLIFSAVLGLIVLISPGSLPSSTCSGAAPALAVTRGQIPNHPVAGYDGQQLVNAAAIMNASVPLHVSVRGETIGVMTAMDESQLLVVDHGDAAGPDSRGLFQQRDNGAWGSYSDRMDPTTSATNFFKALLRVPGWETLPPTIAAHRVQGNADPYVYAAYWDRAVLVVRALAGVEVTAVSEGTGAEACTDAASAAPTGAGDGSGWTKPAVGPVTSPFSLARRNPVLGVVRPHQGTDIGARCDAPILAANSGTIVQAGPEGGYGNLVTVDHGDGVVTRYAHMYANGILRRVGDRVRAGQQIARVGAAGTATACHLHFEVRVADRFVDPQPFMTQRGAPLG